MPCAAVLFIVIVEIGLQLGMVLFGMYAHNEHSMKKLDTVYLATRSLNASLVKIIAEYR